MSKMTVDQVRAKIAALQEQEQALLSREVDGVVARIREAIAYYKLTPEHLFGKPASGLNGRARVRKQAAQANPKEGTSVATKAPTKRRRSLKGIRVAIKFKDDQGNTWSGRGSQPRWLREALGVGKSLKDFSV